MSRLCVHTITTKPLSLEQCLAEYPKRGVSGITIWRQALEGVAAAPHVAVVSGGMAARYWPGESAVGKRILGDPWSMGESPPPVALTVVGVVWTVRASSVTPPLLPAAGS